MANRFRLDKTPDDVGLKRAAIYFALKYDLRKPIFELDRNEVLQYYRIVYSSRRVEYMLELEGFDNDLNVLVDSGFLAFVWVSRFFVWVSRFFVWVSKVFFVWVSKVVSYVYKCIYGSIRGFVKRIVYIFKRTK
jgi:hypothetical protein